MLPPSLFTGGFSLLYVSWLVLDITSEIVLASNIEPLSNLEILVVCLGIFFIRMAQIFVLNQCSKKVFWINLALWVGFYSCFSAEYLLGRISRNDVPWWLLVLKVGGVPSMSGFNRDMGCFMRMLNEEALKTIWILGGALFLIVFPFSVEYGTEVVFFLQLVALFLVSIICLGKRYRFSGNFHICSHEAFLCTHYDEEPTNNTDRVVSQMTSKIQRSDAYTPRYDENELQKLAEKNLPSHHSESTLAAERPRLRCALCDYNFHALFPRGKLNMPWGAVFASIIMGLTATLLLSSSIMVWCGTTQWPGVIQLFVLCCALVATRYHTKIQHNPRLVFSLVCIAIVLIYALAPLIVDAADVTRHLITIPVLAALFLQYVATVSIFCDCNYKSSFSIDEDCHFDEDGKQIFRPRLYLCVSYHFLPMIFWIFAVTACIFSLTEDFFTQKSANLLLFSQPVIVIFYLQHNDLQ